MLVATGLEVSQSKFRCIVEGLSCGIAKRGALLGDTVLVEHLLGFKHFLLCRFKHRIHTPNDAHRQDHIRVFSAFEEVAQNIVSNAPDEGDDFVVGCLWSMTDLSRKGIGRCGRNVAAL